MDELTGKRILLRKYRLKDVEEILKWRNDKETTIYMGRHFREGAGRDQIESTIQEVIESDSVDSLYYVIADVKSRRYIGGISLTSIDFIDKNCILSIVIGDRQFRKKGIASEAISLIADYGFNKLGLHKIELNVCEKNNSAIRCYQRNGFVIEGISKDHFYIDGKYENLIYMGLINT